MIGPHRMEISGNVPRYLDYCEEVGSGDSIR